VEHIASIFSMEETGEGRRQDKLTSPPLPSPASPAFAGLCLSILLIPFEQK
jgi:hypothetical protein